jgi:CMP-N,N'-diacetyllegionaminic acid synthase
MHHIAIITARAGSKRVPGKNLLALGGMPLIGWTIAAARRSGCYARIMVSTDSAEIRTVAVEHGAEVPFLRPPELATDTAGSTEVLLDHLQRIGIDDQAADALAVTLLQPTSPFRRATSIVRALHEFAQHPAKSLVGVVPTAVPLAWLRVVDDSGALHPLAIAGTDGHRACALSGLIYVVSARALLRSGSLYGDGARAFWTHDPIESLDIDTPADWAVASALVAAGEVSLQSVLEG